MSAAGRQAPGRFVPVIDRNRCEGKGPCVPACPHDVLTTGVLDRQTRASLTLVGRVRAWAHGGRQVQVIRPEACHACGACVRVCPEQALTLARAPEDRDPSAAARPPPGRA